MPLREVVRRFWPLARRYRKPFAAGVALAALLPAVEAAEIWLFKLIVDNVLVAEALGPLAVYVPMMVGLALFGALLSFGDEYAATWVGERFTLDLRTKLFAHLQTLEPDALDRRRHGDVLARVTGDVHAIETLLLSAIAEVVQAAARLLFFAGALFLLSWKLALASLFVIPIFYFAAHRFARLARRAARERRRRSGSLSAVAEEALANVALVQSANTQEHELQRFRRENKGAMAAELAGTRISGLFAPIIDLIELAGAITIIVLGTWALGAGDLTIGGLLAFLAYLAQLYRPVRDLSRLGQTIFEAQGGAERVIELLDTEPRVREHPQAKPLDRVCGVLELDDVTFTYPGSERPALVRCQPHAAAWPLHRARRRERRREVHRRQARAALRRPGPGHGAARRPRPARRHAALAARQRRAAAAGRAAVRRHRARQRRLRAAAGDRRRRPRRARRGRRRRARGRAAGRHPHARGPARPGALGWPAQARRDGARAAAGRAGARARRADAPASTPRPRAASSRRCGG